MKKSWSEAIHGKPGVESVYLDDVECIKETDKAILCWSDDFGEMWFPKSHVTADSQVTEKGDEGTLAISKWLAEQKGL